MGKALKRKVAILLAGAEGKHQWSMYGPVILCITWVRQGYAFDICLLGAGRLTDEATCSQMLAPTPASGPGGMAFTAYGGLSPQHSC